MKEKKGLLVASFGTSHEGTEARTIGAIERELRAAYPDRSFYRAWTSRRIVKKIEEMRGIRYDHVPEALERMRRDGIRDVLIQPTHMLEGAEYRAVSDAVASAGASFAEVRMGEVLLAGTEDVRAIARALEEVFGEVKETDMLALMGHGSASLTFPVYDLLEKQFLADGYPHVVVGTVEHEPGFAPVLRRAGERAPETIYLAPFLVVAGEHAIHDMAGGAPTSWKGRLERAGFRTVSILKGIGEYPQIQRIYTEHAGRAKPAGNRQE